MCFGKNSGKQQRAGLLSSKIFVALQSVLTLAEHNLHLSSVKKKKAGGTLHRSPALFGSPVWFCCSRVIRLKDKVFDPLLRPLTQYWVFPDCSYYRYLWPLLLDPKLSSAFWERVMEPFTLAVTSRTDISLITSHDHQQPAVNLWYRFFLQNLCTLRSIVSNESSDCNIFSGAAPSSVKSSDCVTIFPVGGGDAVDCVPLLRMWFSGLVLYKQGELEGGCLCGGAPTNPASYVVFRFQTERLKPFTRQKLLFVYVPHSLLRCHNGSVFKI